MAVSQLVKHGWIPALANMYVMAAVIKASDRIEFYRIVQDIYVSANR
jgi:hypothetical protein